MATAAKFEDDFEFPDEKESRLKAEDDKKVEIEIEDDTPPEDRGRKPMKDPVEDPTEEELASYDEKVQARIKKFTRGYHDERRAKEEALRERQAAEAFARQMYEENKKLQEQLSSGSKKFIETSKNAAEIELQAAKKKFKEAYESGDPDAIAEAQTEIAQATLRINQVSELRPIEVKEQEFRPVAEDNAAPQLPRRTQRWLQENNDWWGKDEEMTAAAMGLDKKLQREYGPEYIGSDEYFKTIDRTMRKRFPEFFAESRSDEDDDDPPRQKRSEPADEDDSPRRATRSASVVAPASRSTPPSRIKLKASQAAIARRLGVPLEEYARQVAQLKRGE